MSHLENAQLFDSLRSAKDDHAAARIRSQIAENNLPLVKKLVSSFRHKCKASPLLDDGDLINSGVEGLFKAIDKFDTERGVAFSTYASHWIRRGIQLAATSVGAVKYRKGYFAPDWWFISFDSLGIDDGCGGGVTRHELIADTSAACEDDIVRHLDNCKVLNLCERVSNHTAQTAKVYDMRFKREMLMPEIAKDLGVSRQRIDQVEKRFLSHVRDMIGAQRRAV